MEWLKQLIEKHTKDGKLGLEALNKEIATEYPKYAIPKDQYNTLAESKKQLEKDIVERDKQLDKLKQIDAAGLKAEIEKLQGENKTAKEKYDADLKDLTLTNAVKLAIAGKVHDESIVSGLVDKSKLIIGDDGKIVGLDEQIASLKEGKAFLFKADDESLDQSGGQKNKPGFRIGNPPPKGQQAMDDAIAAAFGNTAEPKK